MREALRDPLRLRHMLDAIRNVQTYMHQRNEEDLTSDSMLFYAVVKNIEIMGEAAYKLTADFKDTHPDTPWRHIVAMRHILVHDYYQIKPSEVFYVCSDDLPLLAQQIESYLTEFK